MDKQSEGLKLLKDIRSINHLIIKLQEEIAAVQSQLESTTIKPKEVDVQSSGSQDPMSDKIIAKIEYEQRLEEYQAALIEKKAVAFKLIMQLPVEEQNILLMKYFDKYKHSKEEIGYQIGYSYRWIWEKIHTAEEHFMQLYEQEA